VPSPYQLLRRTHALRGARSFYNGSGCLGQLVDQRGATTREGLERGGLIVRGALLPTPIQDAAPLKGERPHGGLLRFPLGALLLVIDLGPEGMPDRCRGPLHA
jgi:hypothetical protein